MCTNLSEFIIIIAIIIPPIFSCGVIGERMRHDEGKNPAKAIAKPRCHEELGPRRRRRKEEERSTDGVLESFEHKF